VKQEIVGRQWHQLDHVQIICTLLQTNNHASTLLFNFTGWMLFLMPNQMSKHRRHWKSLEEFQVTVMVDYNNSYTFGALGLMWMLN